METIKLTESEYRFAVIVWDHAPLASMELVKLCERQLNWKKSTTYTVLKKLCVQGVFQNEDTIVSALIPRDQVEKIESERFINRIFSGSLPKFLTTFIHGKKLSAEEAEELIRLINSHREEA